MKIDYSKRFIKQFEKCPMEIQQNFRNRLVLFIENKNLQVLSNHKLQGKLDGHRSINITGDWRAVFREFESGQLIYFEMIGTHSELYK